VRNGGDGVWTEVPVAVGHGPKAGVPRIAPVGTTTTRGDRSEWRICRAVYCAVASLRGRCARSRSVAMCAEMCKWQEPGWVQEEERSV
jgi:hypothetical protein